MKQIVILQHVEPHESFVGFIPFSVCFPNSSRLPRCCSGLLAGWLSPLLVHVIVYLITTCIFSTLQDRIWILERNIFITQ